MASSFAPGNAALFNSFAHEENLACTHAAEFTKPLQSHSARDMKAVVTCL